VDGPPADLGIPRKDSRRVGISMDGHRAARDILREASSKARISMDDPPAGLGIPRKDSRRVGISIEGLLAGASRALKAGRVISSPVQDEGEDLLEENFNRISRMRKKAK
jgi:hypothetical protein